MSVTIKALPRPSRTASVTRWRGKILAFRRTTARGYSRSTSLPLPQSSRRRASSSSSRFSLPPGSSANAFAPARRPRRCPHSCWCKWMTELISRVGMPGVSSLVPTLTTTDGLQRRRVSVCHAVCEPQFWPSKGPLSESAEFPSLRPASRLKTDLHHSLRPAS